MTITSSDRLAHGLTNNERISAARRESRVPVGSSAKLMCACSQRTRDGGRVLLPSGELRRTVP